MCHNEMAENKDSLYGGDVISTSVRAIYHAANFNIEKVLQKKLSRNSQQHIIQS